MNKNNLFNEDEKHLIDNAEDAKFDNLDMKKSQFLVHNLAEDISGPIKKRKRPLRNW